MIKIINNGQQLHWPLYAYRIFSGTWLFKEVWKVKVHLGHPISEVTACAPNYCKVTSTAYFMAIQMTQLVRDMNIANAVENAWKHEYIQAATVEVHRQKYWGVNKYKHFSLHLELEIKYMQVPCIEVKLLPQKTIFNHPQFSKILTHIHTENLHHLCWGSWHQLCNYIFQGVQLA